MKNLAPWLAFVFLSSGCASQPSVDVFVIGMTPLESTGLEQRMRIDLRLLNSGDAPFAARGMKLALDVNGKPLARGVSNQPFSVPSLGEATTSIVTSTSLFDVVRQALEIGTTPALDYEVSGTIYRERGFPSGVGFRRAGTLGQIGGVVPAAPK